jgi:hypothetical protein
MRYYKPIKIETRKVVTLKQGTTYRIISIRAARYEDLPVSYLEQAPAVWLDKGGSTLLTLGNQGFHPLLVTGSYYRPEALQAALQLIQRAGNRLTQIADKLREEAKNWKGEETFTV